jgi:tight adherence protein B
MRAGIAGLCAAGAVFTFPGRTAKRRLDALGPRPTRRAGWSGRSAELWGSVWPGVGVGVLAALVLDSPIAVLAVPLVVWRVRRAWRGRIIRLAAEVRRKETVALCLAFRAELRGGRPARDALLDACGTACPELAARLEGSLRLGGEVVPLLRRAAAEDGREALNYLAACWHAAEGGAGLARAVGRLALSLRAGEYQRREVAAELAGVRASARLLAALPLIGIALGSMMGAHPVHVLLSTLIGQACLLVGGACALGGLAWMERIVRSAEVYA